MNLCEFRYRYGSPGGAFLSMSMTLFAFILIPLSAFALANGVFGNMMAEGGGGGMSPDQMQKILDELWSYVHRLIRYSIPLIFIAMPVGFYRAGSYAKIPFRLLFALYSVLIILSFTNGGVMYFTVPVASGSGGSFTMDSVTIALDISTFIYISILIGIAGAFLAFTEFASNRKEFVEKTAEIDGKGNGSGEGGDRSAEESAS